MENISKTKIKNKKEKNIANIKSNLKTHSASILKLVLAIALFAIFALIVNAGDVIVENGKIDVDSKLFVADNGNVGVGTTSPGEKLVVNGRSILNGITIGDYGDAVISTETGIGGSGKKLQIKTLAGDGTGITIATSGNVGIGTTTPSEKLEVSGSIKAGGVRKMQFTRSLSNTVAGSFANIGTIDANSNLPSYAKIKIWTHHSDALMFNEYEVSSVYYTGTNTGWVEVPPKSVRSWANDGRKTITVDARFASSGGWH